MTRYLKIIAVAIAVLGLMASGAMAGTLTIKGDKAQTVAKELIYGAAADATTDIDFGDVLTSYTPTAIAGGFVGSGNGSIEIKVSAGTLTNNVADPVKLQICRDNAGDFTLLGNFNSGSETDTLVFTNSAANISNGFKYVLMVTNGAGDVNCNAAADAGDLTLAIPANTDSVTATVTTYNTIVGEARDTSNSPTVVSAVTELSAKVSAKAAAKIDPAKNFMEFLGGNKTDTIEIQLDRDATINHKGTYVNGDKVKIVLDLSEVTALKTDEEIAVASKLFNDVADTWTVSYDAAAKKATCSATLLGALVGGDAKPVVLTLTVDGTTSIKERTFKASVEFEYKADSPMKSHTGDSALLTQVDAGEWRYDAIKVTIPYLSTSPKYKTTCMVNNTQGTVPLGAIINVVTAGNVVPLESLQNLQIGTIAANQQGRVVFSGTSVYVSQDSTKTKSVAALGEGQSYSAELVLTGGTNDLTFTCIQTDGTTGSTRIIPVVE
jgi:hypothetical protein